MTGNADLSADGIARAPVPGTWGKQSYGATVVGRTNGTCDPVTNQPSARA